MEIPITVFVEWGGTRDSVDGSCLSQIEILYMEKRETLFFEPHNGGYCPRYRPVSIISPNRFRMDHFEIPRKSVSTLILLVTKVTPLISEGTMVDFSKMVIRGPVVIPPDGDLKGKKLVLSCYSKDGNALHVSLNIRY